LEVAVQQICNKPTTIYNLTTNLQHLDVELLQQSTASYTASQQQNNQALSEYKHSLTFRVRRYTHLQCIRL